MKKFLKAVALATVMCMLLSTAAFASNDTLAEGFGSAGLNASDDTVIEASVLGVTAGEQVVLLIVDKDVESLAAVTENDIMYIDQKAAVAVTEGETAGKADFNNILVKESAEKVVDIYVGSATTNGPKLIGNNVDVSGAVEITIVQGNGNFAEYVEGDAKVKHAIAAAVNVATSKAAKIDAMFWGIGGIIAPGKTEAERRYFKVVNPAGEGNVDGSVQFAATIDLGLKSEGYTIADEGVDVSAIFLIGGEDFYTNEALDKDNKKTN